MSRSSWYRRVRRGSGGVTQGDIIFDCQILKPLFDVTGQMVNGVLGADVKSIKFNQDWKIQTSGYLLAQRSQKRQLKER